MSGASLTQMQLLGLGSETNVAEGYPRYEPSEAQAAILARLPELMTEARRTPYPILDARAQSAFLHALGQHRAPIGSGRIISFYASTVAIDVAGAALARRARRVGLVHPVIDCVPALLRARGLELVPLPERALKAGTVFDREPGLEAVIAASPNNPAGTVLTETELERLGAACAARGVPLVIDQCFRGFDPATQFDSYEVLDRTGVEYVIVEDTGKLWPTAGVKLGFLAWSANADLPIAEVAADVLLNAPPFSAVLVERFALDMAAGGMARIHERIVGNRAIVAGVLEGCELATQADGASRVSVSRIRLGPGARGTRLWGQLLRLGIHSVPCRPFYWADPRTGERYLRIALSREPDVVERATRGVRAVLEGEE
jgi:aspartate/methionine/tyrosine aminotransferase